MGARGSQLVSTILTLVASDLKVETVVVDEAVGALRWQPHLQQEMWLKEEEDEQRKKKKKKKKNKKKRKQKRKKKWKEKGKKEGKI